KRVFVTGVSAGGAMTAALLANYPDRFSGGATHAGIVYGCGTDAISGIMCMNNPGSLTPQQYGDKVRSAGGSYAGGAWPTLQVWHGSADQYVAPSHLTALVKQWTNVHGIDQTADATASGGNASIKRYANGQGKVLVESYEIAGMKHGVAINPGASGEECGEAAEYYFDNDVCHPFVAGKFWGIIVSSDDGFAGGAGTTTTTSSSTSAVSTTTTSSLVATTNTVATTTSTTGSGACFTANNVAHVGAGRAYLLWGYAYAMGSGQKLGSYSIFATSKLRQSKPAYFSIDNTCP
ncbi:MAG TPA: PHB depolymerase family esterase, partial [Rhodocyclaceae bacterium]|nr:PHB depolymerase family esterase [Rhodocyclaceae bacterium]